jgi:hypothetical protein
MKGSWMSKFVQNLFKEMPIDNKASALEMNEGSPAMNDEKPYHKTRRAAQNRGDIISTPEQIERQKAKLAAKKAKLAAGKK